MSYCSSICDNEICPNFRQILGPPLDTLGRGHVVCVRMCHLTSNFNIRGFELTCVSAESDQHVNIYSFAIRCDRMWPSTQ